jgi:hypothetical protein
MAMQGLQTALQRALTFDRQELRGKADQNREKAIHAIRRAKETMLERDQTWKQERSTVEI